MRRKSQNSFSKKACYDFPIMIYNNTAYKLLVYFSKRYTLFQKVRRKLRKVVGARSPVGTIDLVKKYSKGKTFADIGALWGVNGLNSFIAEESGATRVTALDVYPVSEKFLEEKRRRNSNVQFVEGDINSIETAKKLGWSDVVLCAGVLYHTPDPIHFITRLRAVTKETLILNTASIPEIPGLRNASIFYPFLSKSQRKTWNRGMGNQMAITGPYEAKEGYGNWFWGMTPSCIESMLNCAGFEVIERHIETFNTIYVCKAVEVRLAAESGSWNTPKDAEYRKFHR